MKRFEILKLFLLFLYLEYNETSNNFVPSAIQVTESFVYVKRILGHILRKITENEQYLPHFLEKGRL